MEAKGKPLACLSGVRVLDLSQFEAGPSSTEALAWLGAEVVKVENPKGGDPGRSIFGEPGGDSFYFLIFNANKKSMAIDLKTDAGKKLVFDLARKADVFVENFAPGAIERLGLGYDVISRINSGIVYAQVKGFGAGSPYQNNLAFDMIAQATGGVMSISGYPDGPPCRTPCCTTSGSPSPPRRGRAARCSARATSRSPAATRRAASIRARAAGPTTTSTSTPAAPTRSTGSGSWVCSAVRS
jgi:crotonobetainyl-CoA:carnitine CoA-transferase CaiB-like acyl-CoA transferase